MFYHITKYDTSGNYKQRNDKKSNLNPMNKTASALTSTSGIQTAVPAAALTALKNTWQR